MSAMNLEEVEALISRLESEDAFERLSAIDELERKTRMTQGFRYSDPQQTREEAVNRWKAWIEERKKEQETEERLRAAVQLTGGAIPMEALKHMIQELPPEKLKHYMSTLVLKMKAEQARCEACGVRHASVRVTEIKSGDHKVRLFCDVCARERGDVLI